MGPPLPLAGAPHVDDGRVVGPDVLEVDLQLGPHLGQLVGEEHVAGTGEAVEDVEPLVCGEVEPEAALAPVGVLEQHVDLGVEHGQTTRHQASHGVAPLDVLDLDDLCSPVRQQG